MILYRTPATALTYPYMIFIGFLYTDTQCGDVMGINERDVSIRKYPDMGIVENECGVELGIGFGCLLFEFRNLEFPTFSVWHFEF